MDLKQYKKKLLRNPEFKEEYYKIDLGLEISLMVLEARILVGVTQEELAKRIGTKQPSIARIENGRYLPSLSFMQKIANALETYLIPPKFGVVEEHKALLIDSKADKRQTGKSDFSIVHPEPYSPGYLFEQRSSSFETKNSQF